MFRIGLKPTVGSSCEQVSFIMHFSELLRLTPLVHGVAGRRSMNGDSGFGRDLPKWVFLRSERHCHRKPSFRGQRVKDVQTNAFLQGAQRWI